MHTRTHGWPDRLTDGWTTGLTHKGHNAITIAHWPLASGANKNTAIRFTRLPHVGANALLWGALVGCIGV